MRKRATKLTTTELRLPGSLWVGESPSSGAIRVGDVSVTFADCAPSLSVGPAATAVVAAATIGCSALATGWPASELGPGAAAGHAAIGPVPIERVVATPTPARALSAPLKVASTALAAKPALPAKTAHAATPRAMPVKASAVAARPAKPTPVTRPAASTPTHTDTGTGISALAGARLRVTGASAPVARKSRKAVVSASSRGTLGTGDGLSTGDAFKTKDGLNAPAVKARLAKPAVEHADVPGLAAVDLSWASSRSRWHSHWSGQPSTPSAGDPSPGDPSSPAPGPADPPVDTTPSDTTSVSSPTDPTAPDTTTTDTTTAGAAADGSTPADGFWSATSFLNTPLSSFSVDPNSATWLGELEGSETYGLWVDDTSWSPPIYHASASTPTATVSIENTGAQITVPYESSFAPDPSGDSQLAVVDDATGCEYEFQAFDPSSLTAHAEATFAIQRDTGAQAVGAGVTGAAISELGGLITPGDIASGSIDHALRIATPINSSSFVAPASSSDGGTPGGIPEGQLVRLDPSLDLSQFDLDPFQLMVATALQRYGGYVADNSGSFKVYAENTIDGSTYAATPDALPWSVASQLQFGSTSFGPGQLPASAASSGAGCNQQR